MPSFQRIRPEDWSICIEKNKTFFSHLKGLQVTWPMYDAVKSNKPKWEKPSLNIYLKFFDKDVCVLNRKLLWTHVFKKVWTSEMTKVAEAVWSMHAVGRVNSKHWPSHLASDFNRLMKCFLSNVWALFYHIWMNFLLPFWTYLCQKHKLQKSAWIRFCSEDLSQRDCRE